MSDTENTQEPTVDLYSEEARRKRFLKVAERRTNRALEYIRLLGNTSNKSLYKYEQADVDKIFDTIDKKLIETKAKFKTTRRDKPFRLE
jgi:hypothetical protein